MSLTFETHITMFSLSIYLVVLETFLEQFNGHVILACLYVHIGQ